MKRFFLFFILSIFLLTGCNIVNPSKSIDITIIDNDNEIKTKAIPGQSVKQILLDSSITLESLDKTNPPLDTILSVDSSISIIRVKEDFIVEESVIPFEQQTVKNESLPDGKTVLIQAGTNGTQQTVYRILYENGIETSRSFVSSEITLQPKPEIVMIGVLSPYTSQPIEGIIAYITSSNAWIMEGSSGNRRPIVSSGDLDGRIFSLSPDREWLLFSRTSTEPNEINSLWIINLTSPNPEPIATNIKNVVHYADWVPGRSKTFTYSTVEYVPTTPGWQANNDLLQYRFNDEGKPVETKTIVETNSGGLYGWWGTSYQWSVDGSKIAYSRPDSIGLVNISEGSIEPLMDISPYQTSSEWAWIPSIKWSEDGEIIYSVTIPNSQNPALTAFLVDENQSVVLYPNCGLFCYPTPSYFSSDNTYLIAFLSAILPDQSETSRYSLFVMDRDGSNQKSLYPLEGIQGLSPQEIKWSPSTQNNPELAIIAQGNLLLVDPQTGAIKNLTGDGSITKIDWK